MTASDALMTCWKQFRGKPLKQITSRWARRLCGSSFKIMKGRAHDYQARSGLLVTCADFMRELLLCEQSWMFAALKPIIEVIDLPPVSRVH